jgi:hypothetical protein
MSDKVPEATQWEVNSDNLTPESAEALATMPC